MEDGSDVEVALVVGDEHVGMIALEILQPGDDDLHPKEPQQARNPYVPDHPVRGPAPGREQKREGHQKKAHKCPQNSKGAEDNAA